MGQFHQREIPRGEYGKASKVIEEVHEALDALDQDQSLMLMIECADMIGALAGALVDQTLDAASVVELEAVACEHLRPRPELILDGESTPEHLARLLELLAPFADAPLSLDVARQAACRAVAIASRHRFTFDQLVRFARLRSRVARYEALHGRHA
jgi:hypothetical protein